MPRVSTDHLAARRQLILDGARSCFARHGYEAATVRRLEECTGLSRGAIFHHFRDKDALFLALAEQDAERMADVVAAQGLVQVMRELVAHPDGDGRTWLGTRLEVSRRLPRDIQGVARRKLRMLNNAQQLSDLRAPPGNQLEALRGDRAGQHSIRINDRWRICFRWERGNAFDVEVVDYHRG